LRMECTAGEFGIAPRQAFIVGLIIAHSPGDQTAKVHVEK
jgi:hypothetical protein